MKIVHIFFTIETGGAEIMMIDIMNRQSIDHDVALVVINRENNSELLKKIDRRVAVYIIGRKYHTYSLMPVIRFNRLLHRLHPDIVHIHNHHVMPMLFCKSRRSRYVFTAHTITDIPQVYRFDKLYAVSQYVQTDLQKRYGAKIPIEVIYNGIDTHAIVPATKQDSLPEKKFRIVQIGRLVHQQKGQDILLEALALLSERYGKSDFSVDFIGQGTSEKFLKEKAESLALSERVAFLGNKDRNYIYAHLHEYDLSVQPSRAEGLGLTVAEAMAAGVPVLVADVEGPMEVIAQGRYGMAFRQGDAADCAEKMNYIFTHYSEISSETEDAVKFVQECFDISRTVANYIKSYHSMI